MHKPILYLLPSLSLSSSFKLNYSFLEKKTQSHDYKLKMCQDLSRLLSSLPVLQPSECPQSPRLPFSWVSYQRWTTLFKGSLHVYFLYFLSLILKRSLTVSYNVFEHSRRVSQLFPILYTLSSLNLPSSIHAAWMFWMWPSLEYGQPARGHTLKTLFLHPPSFSSSRPSSFLPRLPPSPELPNGNSLLARGETLCSPLLPALGCYLTWASTDLGLSLLLWVPMCAYVSSCCVRKTPFPPHLALSVFMTRLPQWALSLRKRRCDEDGPLWASHSKPHSLHLGQLCISVLSGLSCKELWGWEMH